MRRKPHFFVSLSKPANARRVQLILIKCQKRSACGKVENKQQQQQQQQLTGLPCFSLACVTEYRWLPKGTWIIDILGMRRLIDAFWLPTARLFMNTPGSGDTDVVYLLSIQFFSEGSCEKWIRGSWNKSLDISNIRQLYHGCLMKGLALVSYFFKWVPRPGLLPGIFCF